MKIIFTVRHPTHAHMISQTFASTISLFPSIPYSPITAESYHQKRINVIGPTAIMLGQPTTMANNVIRMSSALSALQSSFNVSTKKLSLLGEHAKSATTPMKNQQPSSISIPHLLFKMNMLHHSEYIRPNAQNYTL
jgi:hypothetical protein